MGFETTALVRFAHVDPAGIVFYPRYFEMLNAAVEDWFAGELGADFQTMHGKMGIGVPTVQLSSQFIAPSVLGELLIIRLTVSQLGRSSCSFSARFTCGGKDRVLVAATLVCMDLKTQKAVPWPDGLRAGLSRHQAAAA